MNNISLDDVNAYYTNKVIIHGATPQGVDWNSTESQEKRFMQLLKITDRTLEFPYALLDFGCGFGSLLNLLMKQNIPVNYTGYDLSEEMLKIAKENFPTTGTWVNTLPEDLQVDFVVASGLFNVKLNHSTKKWQTYILNCLDLMNKLSTKGFSFNILTSYSDPEFMKDYLYYASPEYYFKHCKLNYSKQVTLLHDYDLYEFTILVRK